MSQQPADDRQAQPGTEARIGVTEIMQADAVKPARLVRAPRRDAPVFPDSSVRAERPKTIEFLSLRETLGMSVNWTK